MKEFRPILILAAAGGIGYALYRYLNRSKTASAASTVNKQTTTAASTAKSTPTISAKLKKYATWIDRIEQLLVSSRIARKSKYADVNQEASYNATELNKLSDTDLKAVVNYWQQVRVRNIWTVFDTAFINPNSALFKLTFRLKDLKF